MKRLLAVVLLSYCFFAQAQDSAGSSFPVKGFAIAAPSRSNLDSFIVFIGNELVPRGINTLVLRVDYNYQYKSHPELVEPDALSGGDIKKIALACRSGNINIIPQINLLGHQSWASKVSKLLEVYPAFDETPWIKIPTQYTWPNADSLYCKSYCPLHPAVHKIVFDLADELCDAFGATAFHAGMDEVFYIGMDRCPRCKGKNKASLFAGEIKTIRDHLALKHRSLWIWGDRLLDGRATGLGMWEASYNNTFPAIDMIPTDITICDWHYERPDKTAVIFAAKGFRVITCPWNQTAVALQQQRDIHKFREDSTPEMAARFAGMMQTVWTDVGRFLSDFYHPAPEAAEQEKNQANTFRVIFPVIQR